MAEIVRMPRLSDTMTEGVVAKWHKKVGDKVKSGDLLADIETDKATMEFESFQDGVLLHIGVPEKGAAPIDSVLAILGKEGEDISSLLNGESGGKQPDTSAGAEKQDNKKQESETSGGVEKTLPLPAGVEVVRMPKLSDTMTEGVVEKWHKKVGDKVKSGELLADIATDKATMEFESFQDGVLIHIGIEEGKSVPVDSVLAILGKGGEDINAILASLKANVPSGTVEKAENKTQDVNQKTNSSNTASANSEQSTPNRADGGRIKASPLAKALAKEKGIDLGKVSGSGDNGRITKSDIENFKGTSASSKQLGGTSVALDRKSVV